MLQPEEKARKYSKIYKEQIANGKPQIFAHEFADLMADGTYHKIYCENYAFAFDNAISQGNSLEYAKKYADLYGTALVDIKRRAGISDDEELIDYNIEKVNAYMKGWEYAKDHQVNDRERFIGIYETTYLNAFYSDLCILEETNEQFDKRVLEMALKKYHKN
jgi:hypothetical protein